MIIKLKDYPVLKAAIKRAFPGYKKHSAILFEAASVEPSGAYWSGGSISSYHHTDLAGNHLDAIPAPGAPQFTSEKLVPFAISPAAMVSTLGTFCGKPSTIVIRANSFSEFGITYE